MTRGWAGVAGRSAWSRALTSCRRLTLPTVFAVAASASLVISSAPAAAAPSATEQKSVCLAGASEVAAALAMAKACGTSVEVLSQTSEYTRVTVSPNGTATLVSSVVPQRVRGADGAWQDVDSAVRTGLSSSFASAALAEPPSHRDAYIHRSKWAYATNNGESSDTTNARVGLNPATGALYRSYFMFDTSALQNTTILSARITMELDHSWSAGPTPVYLYQTASFSAPSGSRLPWSALPLGSAPFLASWSGNANESLGQPNVIATFGSAALLNSLRDEVTKSPSYTVGLCACEPGGWNESRADRWKRFETSNAYLIVTYELAS